MFLIFRISTLTEYVCFPFSIIFSVYFVLKLCNKTFHIRMNTMEIQTLKIQRATKGVKFVQSLLTAKENKHCFIAKILV